MNILVIRTHNIQVVMHLAAAISVEESMSNPWRYYQENVTGTLSLIKAMRLSEVNLGSENVNAP